MTRVQYMLVFLINRQQASSLTLWGTLPVHMAWTHLALSWASPDMDGCCIKLACKKIFVEPSFSIASGCYGLDLIFSIHPAHTTGSEQGSRYHWSYNKTICVPEQQHALSPGCTLHSVSTAQGHSVSAHHLKRWPKQRTAALSANE